MVEVYDFEKAKVRKYIKIFHQGVLPEYLTSRAFKKDHKNIDAVLNHWYGLLDDKAMAPVMASIRAAYVAYATDEIRKETQSSSHIINHLARMRENYKTEAKFFWNPGVHAGYPKDQNPVKIFCYEYSQSYKKFHDHPYAITDDTKLKLQFGSQVGRKMLEALKEDMQSIDEFIVQWCETDHQVSDMADLLEVKEAKMERDEFMVCANTIKTILDLMSEKP